MFAYGNNEVHDCECPAVSAGYSPTSVNTNSSLTVACHFDYLVKEMDLENKSKLLSEDEAKEVWERMLEEYEEEVLEHGGSIHVYEVAKDIAEKLGWDDIL
jgi:hypothetical protein